MITFEPASMGVSTRCVRWLMLGAGLLACCSPSPARDLRSASAFSQDPGDEVPATVISDARPTHAEQARHADAEAALKRALDHVSQVRGLVARKPIPLKTISREALLTKLTESLQKELPPGVLFYQGEALRALGTLPASYDFEAGILSLLRGQVAGFYYPDDGTMYLIDDVPAAMRDEVLHHELVHALQDQAFGIAKHLEYKPEQGDRASAAQALIEGDATSAGLEVTYGNGFTMDREAMRTAFSASSFLSISGWTTPSILKASLISPYVDGFAFVQALRARANWGAVDDAFRTLPETSEQILHPEKYFSREPAAPVPALTAAGLPAGFEVKYRDTLGENGLLQVGVDWSSSENARTAAAGWGGDRYAVFERRLSDGELHIAAAFRFRMDSDADAGELAGLLKKKWGGACSERPDLGAIAWLRSGRDVVLVAGPYQIAKGAAAGTGTTTLHSYTAKAASTCVTATAWAAAALK